ncbi:hypothetical protein AVEN_137756-1 [Araneus ventricosus]|uniref:Uncharacterized protein n=1 Tax=Araneus ventricosus TaxID=182803 RepID=A0A4Y2K653_ARAVE|nr:hypothetical protein AVEN_137756-1 [Araneus ventricosus]
MRSYDSLPDIPFRCKMSKSGSHEIPCRTVLLFKFCFETPCYTHPHFSFTLPTADFPFYFQHDLASKRGPNLGRPFDLAATFVRGQKLNRRMRCWILSSVESQLPQAAIAFSCPCSENSSLD